LFTIACTLLDSLRLGIRSMLSVWLSYRSHYRAAWINSWLACLILLHIPIRTAVRPMQVEKFFKLAQLSLETHIWKNYRTTFASKCECSLEVHMVLVHQKGNNTWGAAGHAGVAMDQDCSFCYSFLYERDRCWEVTYEGTLRIICDVNNLVSEIFREKRFYASCHL